VMYGLLGCAPVARDERTTVPDCVGDAQTLRLLLELIAEARSWIVAPAARSIVLPSIVIVSAAVGLVNENVRWAALASCVTVMLEPPTTAPTPLVDTAVTRLALLDVTL